MLAQPRIPKILDPAVFEINVDRPREIKVTNVGKDEYWLRVIEVPDVYKDYVSVRQLALEIPSVFAHYSHKDSAFPGWRGSLIVDQKPLWTLINNVLLTYLEDEWGGQFTQELNFPFITGIINTKSIIRRVNAGNVLGGILPHRDLEPPAFGKIAGSIYLNLPDECAGGTSFYDHTAELHEQKLLYQTKMVPNTMVLYQQRIPHSITQESMDDYREHFRIAQNFFIGDKY